MGCGPAGASQGVLAMQYQRGYIQQSKAPAHEALSRTVQVKRYLNKADTSDPKRVLELGPEREVAQQGSHYHWRHLDPNADPHRARPDTIREELESWSRAPERQRFDLVLSTCGLEYLKAPRAHLKAIARVLEPTGLARIEVQNLCAWPQRRALAPSQDPRAQREALLCPERPHLFTPHALATMCSHAGLAPVELEMGETIVLVCRLAKPHECRRVFPGPSAQRIASRLRRAGLDHAPTAPSAPQLPGAQASHRLEFMN